MRKRLYIDIEVSPNVGVFWQSGHKISVGTENIIRERAVMVACWKWEGQKKVYSATWDAKQSDKELVKTLAKICESASEIVAHNGDRFDLPWLRTRALFHGVLFPHSLRTVDTLKLSRNQFKFNSNRLDYISKFTGGHGKLPTQFAWWLSIMFDKNKKAMDEMVKYCKMDVLELERVHQIMIPYIKPKVSVTTERLDCPECGSDNTGMKERTMLVSGSVNVRMRCNCCHVTWSIPEKTYQNANKARTIRR